MHCATVASVGRGYALKLANTSLSLPLPPPPCPHLNRPSPRALKAPGNYTHISDLQTALLPTRRQRFVHGGCESLSQSTMQPSPRCLQLGNFTVDRRIWCKATGVLENLLPLDSGDYMKKLERDCTGNCQLSAAKFVYRVFALIMLFGRVLLLVGAGKVLMDYGCFRHPSLDYLSQLAVVLTVVVGSIEAVFGCFGWNKLYRPK